MTEQRGWPRGPLYPSVTSVSHRFVIGWSERSSGPSRERFFHHESTPLSDGGRGALGATQVKSHLLGSPNDTIRVACVGVRGQGNSHLKEYGKMKNVEIAAICDIDETV